MWSKGVNDANPSSIIHKPTKLGKCGMILIPSYSAIGRINNLHHYNTSYVLCMQTYEKVQGFFYRYELEISNYTSHLISYDKVNYQIPIYGIKLKF
jgi:hypothetical protein